MVAVPIPLSSTPGNRPGEGEGRLINAYAVKEGDRVYVRRPAGLTQVINTVLSGCRGLIDVNGVCFAVIGTSVVNVTTQTILTGEIPGSEPVTLARNNRVTGMTSTPDVVAVRQFGNAYVIDPVAGTVSAYPDADLPTNVNSVAFLDGYFVFSVSDGRIFASDPNTTAVNALSFTTAEANPDGLVRGIVRSGKYYAMGAATVEVYENVGASPFPLARTPSVIPVGLYRLAAVAGFGTGWGERTLFVGSDPTVRALEGYEALKVSTPDVERFILASNPDTLEALAYTAKGNAFWALSSNIGTWEFNLTTGVWHERVSQGAIRWRASRSVKIGEQWYTGDTLSGRILRVDEALTTEVGSPVTWTVESGPLKDYPIRVDIPSLFLDFTEADGATVSVSWSHDGGKVFSVPLSRSLAQADRYPVQVNRLGLSTQHGFRLRVTSTATQDFALLGASIPDPEPRAA